MDTSQLQCCIQCDSLLRQHVLGVFAADQLPQVSDKSYPYGFITNTDVQAKRGQHWCAFYANGLGETEFFDSYGLSPRHYNHLFDQWLQNHSLQATWNTVQIQSEYSSVCGLYCLFYLRQRLMGRSLNRIVHLFSVDDLVSNDSFIYEYISNVYSQCTSDFSQSNQVCLPLIKT